MTFLLDEMWPFVWQCVIDNENCRKKNLSHFHPTRFAKIAARSTHTYTMELLALRYNNTWPFVPGLLWHDLIALKSQLLMVRVHMSRNKPAYLKIYKVTTTYSLRFKIKITFGHKLHYEIKVTYGEITLKLRQTNWNVAINNTNVVADELPSQITVYTCLMIDTKTPRRRRTRTRFYVWDQSVSIINGDERALLWTLLARRKALSESYAAHAVSC